VPRKELNEKIIRLRRHIESSDSWSKAQVALTFNPNRELRIPRHLSVDSRLPIFDWQ
jgi:hypothetical protein